MKAFPNWLGAVVFISFLLTACKQTEKESQSGLTRQLDSLFTRVPSFSGVVLVAERGVPVYHKAFGYLNFETNAPLDTASVFELASVSKQFTAMVIMMLKEDGKLNYDDLLDQYIQGLPYPGITIRHLLNHTSGLPDYQGIMDEHWDKSKVAGNADNIEYLIKYHPDKEFEPGEKYKYSNTGYMLLASIAESASGVDFIEFCRERIFKPLRMSSTDIRTQEQKNNLTNLALGHIEVKEKRRFVRADSFPSSNYTIWLGNRKGPGRISSTAGDLLKWDKALYGNVLLTQTSLAEGFNPARLNNDSLSYYGFGWQLESGPWGRVVRHSGDNPGYKTHLIRYLDANKTMIILCNNAHEKFEELLQGAEELIAKKK